MEFTPEQKAAIDAMIDEATAGLVAKNKQLLTEKRKLQSTADIDPQQLTELEQANEKLMAELKSTQKASKDAQTMAETLKQQYLAESGFTQKLLIDNGLTDALVKSGVSQHYLNAAKSMFSSKVQIVADGDTRIAKIGDKALADAITEWVGSDEGKHFIAAPANSGGGSQGGTGGKSGAKQMSRSDFEALSPTQKSEFSKSGGSLI